MRILAIESSAKAASVAVVRIDAHDTLDVYGAVEAYCFQDVGLTHSRTLMPMLEDLLKNSDLSLGDCDAIAVARGPGSFTGIRIGVAAAKGLALATGLPLHGVSTLEAMAYKAGTAVRDGLILCAMDARRGEVYTALFDADGGRLNRLRDDTALPIGVMCDDFFADSVKKNIFCVGDGAELCYNELTKRGINAHLAAPHIVRQSAVGVAMVAALAVGSASGDASAVSPVYLRLSQAERERLERKD